jgi:hypothetical protein
MGILLGFLASAYITKWTWLTGLFTLLKNLRSFCYIDLNPLMFNFIYYRGIHDRNNVDFIVNHKINCIMCSFYKMCLLVYTHCGSATWVHSCNTRIYTFISFACQKDASSLISNTQYFRFLYISIQQLQCLTLHLLNKQFFQPRQYSKSLWPENDSSHNPIYHQPNTSPRHSKIIQCISFKENRIINLVRYSSFSTLLMTSLRISWATMCLSIDTVM